MSVRETGMRASGLPLGRWARELPPFLLMFVLTTAFGSCSWCKTTGNPSDGGTDAGHVDSGAPPDSGSNADGGDAGPVDAGPPTACFTNPQGYLQLINACTNASAIIISDTPPCLLSDGGLPPTTMPLPSSCLPSEDAGMVTPCSCPFGESQSPTQGCVPGLGQTCSSTDDGGCPSGQTCFGLLYSDAGQLQFEGWCNIVGCQVGGNGCGTNGNFPNSCVETGDGGTACQLACDPDGGNATCIVSTLQCMSVGGTAGICVVVPGE